MKGPPRHNCNLYVQTFLEADIQALKEAVQLTRHEAVQALKHTQGSVNKAFTNELAALDVHVSFVDSLVQNYALQRCASLGCLDCLAFKAPYLLCESGL